MRSIKAGIAYFALVFGAGFVLGVARVLSLVPHLGERLAELVEMPVMFVVILLSARVITGRFALPTAVCARLAAGLPALGLPAAAELLLGVALPGRSIGQCIASRDPVSGSAYLVMLALFALMPLIIARVQLARASPRRPDELRDETRRTN